MRFLPVSLTTILVELADLDETLALFASLQSDPVEGIEETVPAARTLMIRFRPEKINVQALAARLASRDLSAKIAPSDNLVEIPVHYDGEDLADVAELTGMSVEEVIRRHTESEFTVAFCGFAPVSVIWSAAIRHCMCRAGKARAPAFQPAPWRWPAPSAVSIRKTAPAAGRSSAPRR